MVTSRLYQLALGLVGTVILGAIGAGLWDAVFKPAFPKLMDFMLTISTLGLSEVRDGMYVEIARGNYERAGLTTLELITGITCGIIIGAVYRFFIITRKRSIDNIDRKTIYKLSVISGRLMISVMFILCIVAGFLFVNTIRVTYIVRASGQLQQLQDIVAPILSDDERMKLRSSVAQIHSREDYQNIVNQISKIAEKNGLSVPSFNIF
jgi:hypothetical protein